MSDAPLNALDPDEPPQARSLDGMDMRLTVGRRVRSGVWVGGTWQPVALGVIVAVHSGYCDVDIMGLHGGAPWVVQYTNTSLREEPHIRVINEREPD